MKKFVAFWIVTILILTGLSMFIDLYYKHYSWTTTIVSHVIGMSLSYATPFVFAFFVKKAL